MFGLRKRKGDSSLGLMSRRPKFGRIYQRKWRSKDGAQARTKAYWIEYYVNGVQRRESSKSEKYTDAEQLLRTRQAEILAGTASAVKSRRVKIAELLDLLLADYELNQKSLKWAKYLDGHLRPALGSVDVSQFTSRHVNDYVTQRRDKGIKNSTINRELSLLRRAFGLGYREEPPLVKTMPKIPKLAEKNIRKGFFDHDDFLKLRSHLPEYLRGLLTFAYYTGSRRGEILGLKWNQIDLKATVVRLEPGETKNLEGRTIPLPQELHEILAASRQHRDTYYPRCEFVFSRDGQRIRSFKTAWLAGCKKAGLVNAEGKPTRIFHDLRRTGVRNLIRAGVPERVAMMISGHKTRSILDRYNIVDERDLHLARQRMELYRASQSEYDKAKNKASSGFEAASMMASNLPKLLN